MKKLLIFAAIAGAALVSCTKSNTIDVEGDSLIGFVPVANKATKALVNGTALDQENDTFGSMAYYYATADATPTEYIANQEISYDADDAKWETEDDYFWPKDANATLSFYSYYPYAASSYFVYKADAADGLTVSTYDVDANQDYDLMIADKVTGASKTATKTYVENGVTTKFHHILAYVKDVQVKTADEYKTSTITLKKITLKTVLKEGTYDGAAWTATTATADKELYNAETDLTKDYVSYFTPDYYLVLPQTLSASTQALEVVYSITTGATTEPDQTATIYLNADADGNGFGLSAFEKNKAYTFQIKIGLDKIYFAPSVEGWEDAGEKEFEVK